jgi:N-methylhydantoinase B
VTLSVINNAFVNVCREMGTAMMRTSYSPIFNEGLDFSCVMFNTQGDLIGQAEFCPTMLGSCQYAMKWMLNEVGLEAFEPGDVYIHNDPYRGQNHMRSGVWPPAPLPPTAPRSIRKGCACPP